MSLGFRTYAKRTIVDGISFPSKLEAALYSELAADLKAGLYVRLDLQQRVDPPKCDHCGVAPAKSVKVDFRTTDAFGGVMYHEAKGIVTDRWKDFASWWRTGGPAPLRVYNAGRSGRTRLVEEIRPSR